MVTDLQRDALLDLWVNWGTAFQFSISAGGEVWAAAPHTDPATVITADTAAELRDLVRDYYAGHPEIQSTPRSHDRAGKCWCGLYHLSDPDERNDPE
jgi:hypothetical protein